MRKKGVYLALLVATLWLVLLLALATAGARASPDTLYVAPTGWNSANNCRTQSSPCASIGYGLSQALSGDTIKVAQGTYTENITIDMNVTLEGGYEPTGWTRDIEAYETIIDGNQSGTVVTFQSGGDGAVLDGFTVQNGEAEYGGGVFIDHTQATVQNCVVSDNVAYDGGGGIAVAFTYATTTIAGNVILSNTTGGGGAGVVIWFGVVTVTNNVIGSNTGLNWDWEGDGIAVWGDNSNARIINNTIVSNSGEGIEADQGTVLARNNIFYGNRCGLRNYQSGATVSSDHNAFWNNNDWDYDNVTPGPGDISVDPLFVDAANGNYHLQPASLCIDRGTNTGAPSTDFEGDLRPFDGDGDGIATVDMGADEYAWWYIYLPLTLKNY